MIRSAGDEHSGGSTPSVDGDASLEDLIDECTDRLQAGEDVDLDELAARHPEHADRLRSLLPSLRMMAEVGRTGPAAFPAVMPGERAVSPPEVGPFELGDYRVLRMIGRGGMGVVYEAVQLSLNRRVALKVLPFAAALDPHQLRRFQIEAQAAAQLHHTSIVPVFSVGCERGVHFYAMQYIEGRTLAALVQDRREASRPSDGPARPSADREFIRSVARLGIQAAEALDHAHRQGIIHRDVKPANLLVDVRGNLWITDFGLARFVNEAGLTVTGDLIGTLRYMSPEQALARRLVLDHRTDIYSLGATLYELSTLRPVVDGRDRQEILRRIAQDEPVPLRRIDSSIPRDFETILLRSLAREPEERYATAQELADDLRLFLEHRPIRARRPNPLERAAKWLRRHPVPVGSTMAVLVLSVVGLAVSTALVNRALEHAVLQRDEARAQRQRADGLYRLSRQAVDEMYAQIAEQWVLESTQLDELQQGFLRKGLRYYTQFAEADDPEGGHSGQLHRAIAYRRAGDIQRRLCRGDQAIVSYRHAIGLLENLPPETRSVREYRYQKAYGHDRLGTLLMDSGQWEGAREAFNRALEIWDDLAADHPTNPSFQRERIRSRFVMGLLNQARGRLKDAEDSYRRALEVGEAVRADRPTAAPSWSEPPEVLVQLGLLLQASERYDEAAGAYRRASVWLAHHQTQFPRSQTWKGTEGTCRIALGILLMQTGRSREAGETFRSALADEGPASSVGRVPDSRRNEPGVDARMCLEEWKGLAGRPPEVVKQRAHTLLESLLRVLPDVSNVRRDLAISHNLLAWQLATWGNPSEYDPRQAMLLARKAVELDPENGEIWNTLGVAYCRLEEWDAAIDALGKSMSLRFGGDSYDWFFLSVAHWKRGHQFEARGWYDRALAWMDARAPADGQLHVFAAESASLMGLPAPPRP